METLELAKQTVHCRVPGLVSRRVGKLIGPGHIATGEDVGEAHAHVFCHRHSAIGQGFHPNLFQPQAVGSSGTTNSNQNLVKHDPHALAVELAVGHLFSVLDSELLGGVVKPQINAILFKLFPDDLGDIGVFLGQQTLAHFHLDHLAAKPRKGMGQFRANGAATKYQQALRLGLQGP